MATLRLTTPDFAGLSDYGHLTFSPWVWEHLINSPILSYNRFKAPDYRLALEEAGFRVLHFETNPPGEADFAQLKKCRPHRSFTSYSAEDLAARHLFIVAEKVKDLS
jgi:hypothetical protein